MKRVLFISYFFPPLANSGTQRPLKFSKYLPEFGWEPLVLTVDRPPDLVLEPALLNEIRPGTHVERVPMLSDVIGDALGRSVGRIIGAERVSSAVSWRLRERRQVPDLYALWRPTARRAAMRLFHRIGFDAIFATGFPWTSFLIARDVARLTGRPFVADFRDPWTGEDLFMPRLNAWTRARHRALERSVLRAAAGVVTLADQLTLDVKALSPRNGNARVITIPNGYDAQDLLTPDPPPAAAAGKRRIVYTGVWKEGYGLDALYDVIAELHRADPDPIANLEVIAAGFAPGEAQRRGIGQYVQELGRIPHAACLGYMKSADALFLPAAAGKRQEAGKPPGKLYEYAASGRPVLAMAEQAGEMARFIGEVGGGVVLDPSDRGALARSIVQVCRGGGLLVPPINRARLEQFERRVLTGQLAALLDDVIQLPQPAALG